VRSHNRASNSLAVAPSGNSTSSAIAEPQQSFNTPKETTTHLQSKEEINRLPVSCDKAGVFRRPRRNAIRKTCTGTPKCGAPKASATVP